MPDNNLLGKAAAKYGTAEHFYLVERSCRSAMSNLRRVRVEKTERMSRLMREVLTENPQLDYDVLVDALKANSDTPFENTELCHLNDIASLEILRLLVEGRLTFDDAVKNYRFLESYDFDELFCEVSPIESLLMADKTYAESDEETRRLCRRNVERYAGRHDVSEYTAASLMADKSAFPSTHDAAKSMYFPLIVAVTIALEALLILLFRSDLFVPLLLLVPIFELSKQLVDMLLGRFVVAEIIPRLKLEAVPDNAPTLVVITSLLLAKESDDSLFERLERYMLSNSDGNVVFGILGDLKDSESEVTDADDAIIENAVERINSLNEKHGGGFALFIRRRKYAESEGRWMGWERKRGAVIELCRLIFGRDTSFTRVIDGGFNLSEVKYIVTLDADTELYPGAVLEMLGAMLHPVNRPIIKNGRVIAGHAVMQPRMETSLESAAETPFAALCTSGGGFELYTTAAFDVYQTIFGEGSFCGKGIFDAAAFIRCIDGRYPEGSVLSHDLLEGIVLRAGYLSSVALCDSTPKTPLAYFMRQHRWIRGDVQAMKFSGKTHKNADGKTVDSAITGIGRFKLTDNILRAVVPLMAFAAIVVSLFCGVGAANVTLCTVVTIYALPMLISLFPTRDRLRRRFHSYVISDLERGLLRLLYELASLPYAAWLSTDAIVRAMWRVNVSRRKTLEWMTAAEGEKRSAPLVTYLKKQWISLISGALLAAFAMPICHRILGVLWLTFPLVCTMISHRHRPKKPRLTATDRAQFLDYTRDMWGFYATYVTATDGHLPPDNVQKSPVGVVAHRTSPTNIGLYLLSAMAVCDVGIIEKDELYERLKNTLATLVSLPKWNGLLYNWYDTERLTPLGGYVSSVDCGNFVTSLASLVSGLKSLAKTDERFATLVTGYTALIASSDLGVLYNQRRKLFYIGVDSETGEFGDNLYDIYMSESRTLSYFAVGEGIVPREHFSRLGRLFTSHDGYLGLLSWTGTMFEYFMPTLLLPIYDNSLQSEALHFAYRMQKKYGSGDVWGRSESGYYHFDGEMNYQYKAFGVQKLGLKRRLDEENVLAPYATFLCARLDPRSALENLASLRKYGMYGRHGFYEALDFTPSRVGGGNAVIRSYMAHHVGMSIVAAVNLLCGDIFVHRFLDYNRLAAYTPLLREKLPTNALIYRSRSRRGQLPRSSSRSLNLPETTHPTETPRTHPRVALLSNGYARLVALSDGAVSLHAGSSAISYPEVTSPLKALTLCFAADGRVYRLGCDKFSYTGEKIAYTLDDGRVAATETLSLHGSRSLWCITLDVVGDFTEITPFLTFEPVLYRPADYLAHPAFAALSVDSTFVADENILLYSCRERLKGDGERWLAVTLEGTSGFEFETMRDRLLPSLYGESDLDSLTTAAFTSQDGACIFPYCAIKRSSITSGGRFFCTFYLSFARTKSEALDNIRFIRREKLRDNSAKSRADYFAATLAPLNENHVGTRTPSRSEMRFVELILSRIYAPHGERQPIPDGMSRGDLWKHGISGDLPILTVEIPSEDFSEGCVVDLLSAYRVLSIKGVRCDLIFVVEEREKYGAPIRGRLNRLISSVGCEFLVSKKGGIRIIEKASDLPLFIALSVVYLRATPAANADSVSSVYLDKRLDDAEVIVSHGEANSSEIGGRFIDGGYTLENSPKSQPWSYVYATPQFGTVVTHNTLGFTWQSNASRRRITAWENDPFPPYDSPRLGERLILSTDSGKFDLCGMSERVTFYHGHAEWSGVCGGYSYTVRAGVDVKLNVKLVTVEFDRPADVEYRIRMTMGDKPLAENLYRTRVDGDTLFFENGYGGEFCDSVGFLTHMSFGKTHVFLLGSHPRSTARSYDYIRKKFRTPDDIYAAFKSYAEWVDKRFAKFALDTGDKAFDVMANFYIPYQTIHARIYARTGYYQSSGAYGFRDQLQDTLGALYYAPELCKRQIIRCAAHQYEEGDVMHWWHNVRPMRGVRTRCSDDYLWLPYVAAVYAKTTGDSSIFDLKIPYLASRPLGENEHERYEEPGRSKYSESIYMHCARAIEYGLDRGFGRHGLPFIGSCDWNDGFSSVGEKGEGESVWLGFFMRLVLREFSEVAKRFGDDIGREKYEAAESDLASSLANAYNGQWFDRAYFDDGTPLGSPESEGCQIDVLPQAFSAIVDGRTPESITALTNMYDKLYDPDAKIMRLFTPPFDRPEKSPGYIAGYVPGVRENGGQYTHAAVWASLGLFAGGMYNRAYEILRAINPAVRYAEGLGKIYRLEEYSLAGDIYSNPDHNGRGGWSHYTGAASWYLRVLYGELCGYREYGDYFTLEPKLPDALDKIELVVRQSGTEYRVKIRRGEVKSCMVDGRIVNNKFYFDKKKHFIEITVENRKGMV